MEEWKEYKLKDVATLTTGFPFDGHRYGKEGIRVVRGDNVTIGSLRWDSDKDKRWAEPFERAKDYSLHAEDIVIGMDGSRVGRNRAQVKKEDLPLLIAQRVACVRHNELSLQSFLYYQIFSDSFEQYIKAVQTGTSIPHVSLKQIGDFPIILPPISKQKKIAEVLSSLDKKIEVNRRINDNFVIESLFEILQIWMLTTPINDNLEQQGQALFEEYVMNPNKPRTQLLNDYALINPTRTISKGRVARCIDMSSLPTKGTFPSDWTFKEFNGGMKFQNGDTIMARITPCLENGKTAYINFLDENEVAFGSTEYIVLSAQEGICSELLYFLARYDDFVSYAVAHMNGSSGRQRVSGNDIANYVMPEITNETMGIVSEKLHKIMEVIKNNSLESRHLAEIRDALLPRLMSGELKLEETKM